MIQSNSGVKCVTLVKVSRVAARIIIMQVVLHEKFSSTTEVLVGFLSFVFSAESSRLVLVSTTENLYSVFIKRPRQYTLTAD